jgi:putative transposase
MNLKHYDHDGRARFVTFCTNRRLPILTNDLFRDVVYDEILAFCRTSHTRLLAYVIMPEHVHLVVVPPETLKLGPAIGNLKRNIARRIVAKLRGAHSDLIPALAVVRNGETRLAFWLKRCFDRNCRTVESVWKYVNYCHWNPVKRKLVGSPDKWKWSSYSYYLDIPDRLLEIDVSAEAGVQHIARTKND